MISNILEVFAFLLLVRNGETLPWEDLECFEPGEPEKSKIVTIECMIEMCLIFWGFCIGVSLDLSLQDSANNCLEAYQAEPDCQYFSFNAGDSACTLSSDCQWVDETCKECVYGQRGCEKEDSEWKIA